MILVMSSMVGLLVHGDNHFIVGGPEPDDRTAVRLARHWSLIRIGGSTPSGLAAWTIRNQEFRENLAWAVIVPGEGDTSPAVAQLLAEMTARGVAIRDIRG
jgi:hypothetical protein